MLLCETGPAEHTNVFWVIVSLFAFRDLKTLSGHLWALSVFPLVVHYFFFLLWVLHGFQCALMAALHPLVSNILHVSHIP